MKKVIFNTLCGLGIGLLFYGRVVITCDFMKNKNNKNEQKKAENLVINIPKANSHGEIVINAEGGIYDFIGDIYIANDGTDGEDIQIQMNGHLDNSESEEEVVYGP